MIHLVTAADEAYAQGLLITVISALRSLSASEEVTFHILDGGLAPDSIEQLKDLSKKNHPLSHLVFHQIELQKFKTWELGPNDSMMAYARLLLGSLVEAEKVIYLDSDMIVLGNLAELWNLPMNGMLALGCEDRKIQKLGDDCPWALARHEEEISYFNSGIIVFNLEQWRLQKMEEQLLTLIVEGSSVYRFHDQTILNYLLRRQSDLLPAIWNWQNRIATVDQAAAVNIIHFITTRKPWFCWSGDLRFRLWRSFYQASIGSPLKLFLSNGSWSGLLFGNFEIQIRRHPWLRAVYVRLLIISSAWKKNNAASQITKHYYTEGLGGRSGDVEFKKNQPALKILQRRVKL